MSRLVISPQARQDLKEIYRYIARDRPAAASRFRQALEAAFAALARNPSMGEARPDFGTDVRVFTVGSYVIVFRTAKASTAIARVFHGAGAISWRCGGQNSRTAAWRSRGICRPGAGINDLRNCLSPCDLPLDSLYLTCAGTPPRPSLRSGCATQSGTCCRGYHASLVNPGSGQA